MGVAIFCFFIVMLLPKTVKFIRLKNIKPPILTITDAYIFDHLENIKYYWEDIDEITGSTARLRINLYDPKKYLNKINNSFERTVKKLKYYFFKNKLTFTIDLRLLDIEDGEQEEFVETLDEYSIQSKT